MFEIRAAVKNLKHQLLIKRALRRNDFANVIWLIGDGRSGTTWIANLLNADKTYREMFEPFHPVKVAEASNFSENMYVPPDEAHRQLQDYMVRVFDGSLTNSWIDRNVPNKRFKGLLVKDVFANLHAKWATNIFPHVRPILLIRNPLSVASSKFVTKRWNWPENPDIFLKDEKLMLNHLSSFQAIIKGVRSRDDYIEKQVLNWCVIHKVLTEQFMLSDIHILCYEDAYARPAECIDEALYFANKTCEQALDKAVLNSKSIVSFKGSSIVENKNPLTLWRENVTPHQLSLVSKLLNDFGFADWYPDLEKPNISTIKNSFLK
ncbi:sulfotransferase domain-containing protein [Paraglaciecola chathamensis]|jgi:hypothetical protein|uniref:Sulfotransferase domain-containing protein n=1 Tax=Paraglaciecola agarilytica NO2 TaxID=1125747 RepID=A0ABQ0I8Y8_9ALTE|nr:sulfotransferase domain-containing protein [Paraglaciecola agarilytica]GAC05844.1 hypothetical protein GAGA_3010 [Paraglaciecola agarilytica NO2]